MNNRQMLFELPTQAKMTRSDFFPAPSNQAALDAIGDWQKWPGGRLLLTGPPGSGRTHLLSMWVSESGALPVVGSELRDNSFRPRDDAMGFAVDDADELAGSPDGEEALFHLYNHAQNRGLPMVLSARNPAGVWGLQLPDLKSRMQACHIARIETPDDALLRMVLVKLCDERQLAVGEETIHYLVPRMERSLRAAHSIVDALDTAAILEQKRVTRGMAARVLSTLEKMKDTE